MSEWIQLPWVVSVLESALTYLPTAAVALGILVGGWLLALIVRFSVFATLKRTTFDNKIAEYLGFSQQGLREYRIERAVSRVVYYLALAFMVVTLFGYLKIDAVVAVMVTLQQLGVASQLIGIAFSLVLGAICLAAALAFGLGGREAAARVLSMATIASSSPSTCGCIPAFAPTPSWQSIR